jgi:hypothetical protein
VRLREINDMDIIAHAGPVTCRVVFAENGNLLALAERDLENERDQVKLGVVIFAARGRCSGGIKVAQACEACALRESGRANASMRSRMNFDSP